MDSETDISWRLDVTPILLHGNLPAQHACCLLPAILHACEHACGFSCVPMYDHPAPPALPHLWFCGQTLGIWVGVRTHQPAHACPKQAAWDIAWTWCPWPRRARAGEVSPAYLLLYCPLSQQAFSMAFFPFLFLWAKHVWQKDACHGHHLLPFFLHACLTTCWLKHIFLPSISGLAACPLPCFLFLCYAHAPHIHLYSSS